MEDGNLVSIGFFIFLFLPFANFFYFPYKFATIFPQFGNTFIYCPQQKFYSGKIEKQRKRRRESKKKEENSCVNATLDGTLSSRWRVDQHKFWNFQRLDEQNVEYAMAEARAEQAQWGAQMGTHCAKAVKSLSGAEGQARAWHFA